MREM
jgi:hypothetical protein